MVGASPMSLAESSSDAVLVLPESLLGHVDGKVLVRVVKSGWLRIHLSASVRLIVLPVVVHLLQFVVDHSCKDAQEGAQDHVLPVTHEINVGAWLISFIHALTALKARIRLRVRSGCRCCKVKELKGVVDHDILELAELQLEVCFI